MPKVDFYNQQEINIIIFLIVNTVLNKWQELCYNFCFIVKMRCENDYSWGVKRNIK